MKGLAALATIAVGLVVAPAAQASHSDLLGRWSLDEYSNTVGGTTPDTSGHGFTGTGVYGAIEPGRFGNALDADESVGGSPAEGVDVADDPLLRPNQLTVLAWVKHSGNPAPYRTIVGKGAAGCASRSWTLDTSGVSGGLRFGVTFNTSGGPVFAPADSNAAGIWDGLWHQVAGTYDGSTVKLWIDGVVAASASAPGGATGIRYGLADNRISIARYVEPGGGCDQNGFQFTGAIDEVRVYNRPLGASDLEAANSDLVGYWPLDVMTSTDGGETPDSSAHGFTGTNVRGTTVAGRFGNALNLASDGDGVDVANNILLRPQRMSVLAWVKRDGPPPAGRYIAGKDCGIYALNTGSTSGALRFKVELFRQEGVDFQTVNAEVASASVWDGKWHAVAGTYDGTVARLYVDGAQVASANAPFGYQVRHLGAGGAFTIGRCAASGGGYDPNLQFTGTLDDVRVYYRALTGPEIVALQPPEGSTQPPVEPGPDPNPNPAPGSTPPSSEPAPRITDVTTTSLGAGRPFVLTAKIIGSFTKLLWDIRGDSGPEIVAAVGQDAIRLRGVRPSGAFTVRAIGPGGGSQLFAGKLPAVQTLGGTFAKTITKRLVKREQVVAVGPGDVLAKLVAGRPPLTCIVPTTMQSGHLEVTGCLTPISSLADVPGAERGILEQVAQQLGVPLERDAMGTTVRVSDAYVSRGPVSVNGVKLTPTSSAAVVLYPQVHAIASSNAAMAVGTLRLASPPRFLLDTQPQNGRIPFGNFGLAAGSEKALAGFALFGDVKVDVTKGLKGYGRGSLITANLTLPPFLRIGGSDLRSRVLLRATSDQGLILDQMRIGPLNADIGALAIQQFKLEYTSAGNEWRGSGKACVVSGFCLDMIPPNGSVVIRDGSLSFAGASLHFPPPGVPLFPGLNLHRIGFGMGLDPTRFTGNAKVVALNLIEIDGRLFVAFPSAATPFFMNRDEVGSGFPAPLYANRYTRPTFGVSADASVRVPVIGAVRLGAGHLLYEYPGYATFGGSMNQGLAGVISIEGAIGGEFNFDNGRFNLSGSVRGCLISVLCRSAFGLVSSRGAAVCLGVGPLSIGGGVTWSPFGVRLWPLDGCKWSPFAERNIRAARARAAQTGVLQTIQIEKGDASRAIELEGTAGAPRVRVTGPGGLVLDTPAGSGFVVNGAIRIIRQETTKLTVVGLQDPPPGAYTIAPLDGSPAVASLAVAEDQRAARVTASVSGRRSKRVLTYNIRRREAQRVTFSEVAGETRNPIGTVNGGGRGTLRFAPAPGRGRRTIEAQFELDGLPAERKTVARFRPPSPKLGRVRRLRVRRQGEALLVSWRRVAGAKRYEVVAATSGAGQRVKRLRKASVRLKRIPRASSGIVTVRAVDSLREGRPARKRFRRAARRPSRFERLPRAPRLR